MSIRSRRMTSSDRRAQLIEVGRAVFADNGYDGPVVIESFTSKVKSISRAAAIWRPLALTQDDLARDGVVFLKGLLQ